MSGMKGTCPLLVVLASGVLHGFRGLTEVAQHGIHGAGIVLIALAYDVLHFLVLAPGAQSVELHVRIKDDGWIPEPSRASRACWV